MPTSPNLFHDFFCLQSQELGRTFEGEGEVCQYCNLPNAMLRQQSNVSQIQDHNLISIKFAYLSYSSYVR